MVEAKVGSLREETDDERLSEDDDSERIYEDSGEKGSESDVFSPIPSRDPSRAPSPVVTRRESGGHQITESIELTSESITSPSDGNREKEKNKEREKGESLSLENALPPTEVIEGDGNGGGDENEDREEEEDEPEQAREHPLERRKEMVLRQHSGLFRSNNTRRIVMETTSVALPSGIATTPVELSHKVPLLCERFFG